MVMNVIHVLLTKETQPHYRRERRPRHKRSPTIVNVKIKFEYINTRDIYHSKRLRWQKQWTTSDGHTTARKSISRSVILLLRTNNCTCNLRTQPAHALFINKSKDQWRSDFINVSVIFLCE